MKSSKRITALIVALTFVLTSVMSFNVFAETDSTFTDLDTNYAYYEAITSLVADGVINGYAEADGTFTFKPDNTITRAEFSKLLAVASNPNYAFNATTTQFSDLQSADVEGGWAIPYIAYAVGTGAINGYEDGTFRPQNPVTYAEATKMIVCTLGYGKVVNTTLTPWYQGYLDVAQQIGLTKRAGGSPDVAAVRGLVAQLIYNMVEECKVYDGIITESGSEIKINTGDSGSGSKLNESEEGVLLGVFEHCLTGDALTKQEVLIDDEIYQLGDCDIDDLKELVGYAVKFSITGSRKKELTRVSKLTGENDKTNIEDWQIESVTADEIEYYADEDDYDANDVSTLKFDENMYVIYNGFVVNPDDIDDDFIEEYLNVNCGEITFISNDGSAKDAEVAIVESYELYHVKTVSTINGVTTFYDTNASALGLSEGIKLDEDDVVDAEGEANVTKISTKGGSATKSSLTGISKNSTVAVAVPYDTKEGTKVIVSAVSFSGTIKEISDDEYVKIGTENYEFSQYFEALLDAGVDFELENGDTAKFYLDPFGKISYLEKTDSSNPYGLAVAFASGSGVDSTYQLKIMTTSGSWLEYPLKDKVKVNGDSCEADEAIDKLKESCPEYDYDADPESKSIVQLVKYVTSTQNGKTVFSELETVDVDDPENGNIVPYPIRNSEKSDKSPFAEGGVLTYNSTSKTFKDGSNNQFMLNGSTIVFVVPQDRSDMSKYCKRASGYFNNTSYCVEPYDVETGTTAKVVICYLIGTQTGTGSIYAGTPVSFVEKISDSTQNGQDGKKVVYYNPGSYEPKEAFAPNDSDIIDDLESLKPGDMVKMYIDGGEIASVKTVYTNGELTTETGSKKDGNDNWISSMYDNQEDYYQVVRGRISTIDNDGKSLNIVPDATIDEDNKDSWQAFTWNDSTSFFNFDEDDKEFVESSDGEIRSYEDALEDASEVIIVVMNRKIVAVYDLIAE